MTGVPRWSRLLLRAGSPRAHRDDIDGDLIEWFQRQAASDPAKARRAYRRLVLRTLVDHARGLGRAAAPHHDSDDTRSSSMIDVLRFETRHAFRALRAAPVQALTMALTLSFAIGAVTAVAVIVNTFLFRDLSYRDADRVLFMRGWNAETGRMRFGVWPGDFLDLQRALTQPGQPFEGAAAYQYWDASITSGSEPAWVQGYRVTPGTFDLLGVPPLLGRAFDQRDVDSGRRPVVISHGLWRRQFGGAPDIVGQTVVVDDIPRVVAAVMPRAFEFPVINFKGDIWSPLELDPAAIAADRTRGGNVVAIARLHPASTIDRAQTAASIVMRDAASRSPQTNRGLDVLLTPMAELGRREARAPLTALFVVVVLLLLAATASSATMVLARGASRRQELAVRGALGARRSQIVRLLAWESLMPIAAGGLIGVGLAAVALASLVRLLPEHIARSIPNVERLRLDASALLVAVAAIVLAALIAAVWPAWRIGRTVPGHTLSLRGTAALPTRRIASGLVLVEVAVSMVLVVVALLLARTVRAAAAADLGFNPDGVLTFSLSLPPQRYQTDETRLAFFERAFAEIAAVPGVAAAGGVNVLPFSTADSQAPLRIDGREPDASADLTTGLRIVTTDYARAAGLRLVEGRWLGTDDRAGMPQVAVINRTLRAWLPPGRSPVGSRISLGRSADARWLTIVGLVDDVRHDSVAEAPRAEVYLPLAQNPRGSMMVAVRAAAGVEPTTIAESIGEAVHRVDPRQPVFGVQAFVERVRVSLFAQHLLAWLMGAFALTAAAVAFVGLYGLVSYSVARQAPEFGVRLALGASPGGLRTLVLGRALRLAVIGAALGLAGAWVVASLLRAVLIGVAPGDPWAYGAAIVLIAAAALAASIGPARRAGRVDAISALRSQ
jgi:predicted permease